MQERKVRNRGFLSSMFDCFVISVITSTMVTGCGLFTSLTGVTSSYPIAETFQGFLVIFGMVFVGGMVVIILFHLIGGDVKPKHTD